MYQLFGEDLLAQSITHTDRVSSLNHIIQLKSKLVLCNWVRVNRNAGSSFADIHFYYLAVGYFT